MKTFLKSRPILSFILITFAITFFFWFLPVMIELPKDIGLATMLLGGCGPLIAGYILTLINSGARIRIGSKPVFLAIFIGAVIVLVFRLLLVDNGLNDGSGKIPTLAETGIGALIIMAVVFIILGINASNGTNTELKENYLQSFLFNQSRLKWYLLALLLLPVMSLSSYYIGKVFGLETSEYIVNLDVSWFVGFFSTFFFFGGNEEFGWRGFLQKELQKKYNPLLGALFISFLWSLWHLPLHYNGFYSTGGFMDLLPRFLWTIPLTIVFSWFYNKSGYSILTVVLLHAMLNNNGKAFGASDLVFGIIALLLCVYCVIDGKMWKKQSFDAVYVNETT